MAGTTAPLVRLVPWAEQDFDLLVRANTPQMTAHLGGPETDEQLANRHRRYLSEDGAGSGQMFSIVSLADRQAVGGIGYWDRLWHGRTVHETGWNVLPEYQGRGLAVAATRALVALARRAHTYRYLHAFPGVDNAPSNGICRRLGFELRGECDFEYPPGHLMHCNDWRLDLDLDDPPQ